VFTQSLQKSIPAQIRQLILDISNDEECADGFVRKLTFAKRFYKHCLCDKVAASPGEGLGAWVRATASI
jgi:hypothetical protein